MALQSFDLPDGQGYIVAASVGYNEGGIRDGVWLKLATGTKISVARYTPSGGDLKTGNVVVNDLTVWATFSIPDAQLQNAFAVYLNSPNDRERAVILDSKGVLHVVFLWDYGAGNGLYAPGETEWTIQLPFGSGYGTGSIIIDRDQITSHYIAFVSSAVPDKLYSWNAVVDLTTQQVLCSQVFPLPSVSEPSPLNPEIAQYLAGIWTIYQGVFGSGYRRLQFSTKVGNSSYNQFTTLGGVSSEPLAWNHTHGTRDTVNESVDKSVVWRSDNKASRYDSNDAPLVVAQPITGFPTGGLAGYIPSTEQYLVYDGQHVFNLASNTLAAVDAPINTSIGSFIVSGDGDFPNFYVVGDRQINRYSSPLALVSTLAVKPFNGEVKRTQYDGTRYLYVAVDETYNEFRTAVYKLDTQANMAIVAMREYNNIPARFVSLLYTAGNLYVVYANSSAFTPWTIEKLDTNLAVVTSGTPFGAQTTAPDPSMCTDGTSLFVVMNNIWVGPGTAVTLYKINLGTLALTSSVLVPIAYYVSGLIVADGRVNLFVNTVEPVGIVSVTIATMTVTETLTLSGWQSWTCNPVILGGNMWCANIAGIWRMPTAHPFNVTFAAPFGSPTASGQVDAMVASGTQIYCWQKSTGEIRKFTPGTPIATAHVSYLSDPDFGVALDFQPWARCVYTDGMLVAGMNQTLQRGQILVARETRSSREIKTLTTPDVRPVQLVLEG